MTARGTYDGHGRHRAGRWLAGLLLLGVTVVGACRAADTDALTPVTQALAFLPWLLVPTVTALLLALLARWWTGLVWAVAVMGLLAWYIEPYGRTRLPDGPPLASLRILTANVEFGQAAGALAAAVGDQDPDLVFVQECDQPCDELLRRELGASHPHRVAEPAAGSHGSVLLSKFPLTPAEGVDGTMAMPGAVADVRGQPVRLQLAHPMPPLPGGTGPWRRELGALRDLAAGHGRTPLVLAGDFNASQDHAAFRRVLDTGLQDAARLGGHDRTPTWPARTTPAFGAQIDHVLLSRDFSVRTIRFLDLPGTDHRAVLAHVTLHRPSG
ncbi:MULTISPECIES: endonuclease/exonuclease/phosphatase family protein [Streptomyces]|uniref:endonuclease/exonuclease/phosphatase family protein n=1 Tax=Streptomyces TaxID=1883 RepID=UPI001B37B2FA|nr:endonuclease/exonuclease/phosphatase family protein [Streptomyces sp. RK62]MBQ0998067.1 endonuclease/exonuclease/phosphatase family protein [Streptomyces sp. RK62]